VNCAQFVKSASPKGPKYHFATIYSTKQVSTIVIKRLLVPIIVVGGLPAAIGTVALAKAKLAIMQKAALEAVATAKHISTAAARSAAVNWQAVVVADAFVSLFQEALMAPAAQFFA
jgi:CO dehydrogenase/acetyl-CoA synthase epsilon subunit